MIKTISRVGATLLFIFAGILLLFSVIYSPGHVYRCLLSAILGSEAGSKNVHTIKASPTPYQFETGSVADEGNVRALFEDVFKTNDLDTFLQTSGTYSFIVMQGDRLLYEHYFNGYQRESPLKS